MVCNCSFPCIRRNSKLITPLDEKQPICNRCERCGFECSGPKGIAFIDHGKSLKSLRSGKRKAIASAARDQQLLPSLTSASLKGFEFQTYLCYTRKYLLRGGPVDLALEDLHLTDLCTAADSRSDAYLLHLSILSLATIFFGTRHRNASITTHGYLLHGKSLSRLSNALSSPQCHLRDDILLSVIALILLEVFVPTGRNYYLKHTTGLENLLELRGTGMLCSPEAFSVFKSVRKMVILASISRRTPSILARKEWKDIAWEDEGVEGHAEKYLFDVLADYTILVAEHDRLIRDSELNFRGAAKRRAELTGRAQDLLEQLHKWKAEWNSHDWSPYFEVVTAGVGVHSIPKPCQRSGLPFLTHFIFQGPSTVTTIMLYNTSLTYVLRILASLAPAPSGALSNEYSRHYPDHPTALLPSTYAECTAMERSAALEICRCIPYYISHKAQLDPGSLTITHLAVRTAFQTLGGSSSPCGEWILQMVGIRKDEVFARGLWVD